MRLPYGAGFHTIAQRTRLLVLTLILGSRCGAFNDLVILFRFPCEDGLTNPAIWHLPVSVFLVCPIVGQALFDFAVHLGDVHLPCVGELLDWNRALSPGRREQCDSWGDVNPDDLVPGHLPVILDLHGALDG